MTPVKTVTVNARIHEDVKQQAEAILSRVGLSRSAAIDMFYRQIIMQNGVPFPVKIPASVPSRDKMSDQEFNAMMLNGLNQALADDSYDLDEVFDEIEKSF